MNHSYQRGTWKRRGLMQMKDSERECTPKVSSRENNSSLPFYLKTKKNSLYLHKRLKIKSTQINSSRIL